MELRGTESADSLVGGADNDVIYGFGGNDTLKGGAGDDVLAGNDGQDILQGGDGDDYLLGGAGNDTLDGGAGNDWAAYEDAMAGVTVDLNKTGAQATGGSGSDKLTSIENVYGSAFNDTLTGNAEANMLVGGAGNDVVSGGKGDDTLWGSEGADTLDGGDGDDYIVGGAGNDIIKGGAGWDWSSYEDATAGVTVDLNKTTAQDTGGAGIDTITGVEHLYGSAFNDTLTGDANANYLWGDAGDDKLVGGAGDDHLSGGAGVNIIDGGDGWDTVDYAFSNVGVSINLSGAPAPQVSIPPGVDTLISIEAAMGSAYNDYIVGNDAENYLYGDAGDDVIYGIGGHDTLDGGEGNDILRGSFRKPGDLMLGGAGDDQIIVWTGQGSEGDATIVDGGSGVDLLSFSSLYDITLDLTKSGDQVIAPGVHMIVSNIENVMGGNGNDRLTGDAGNNVINGGLGDDVLDGGAGFDIASYQGDKSVRVDLSKAGPQDTRGAGIDTLSNFEGLRGSLKADILIGDAKDNTFEGGSGDDIIDGGAGTDTAIFLGSSTEYAWTLNANGTWTVKGIDGVDTLLNVEKLQFSDKTVTLSPSTTTVTVDDLVSQPKALVSSATGNFRDAVLSPDGLTAYVSDKDGYVSVIDAQTGQLKSHLKVGTSLGGMDVSKDGRSLVVVEQSIENVTGTGATYQGTVKVHLVDLATGNVTDYATTANGDERQFYDAAFFGEGKVVISQVSVAFSRSIVSLDLKTGDFKQVNAILASGATLSVTDDKSKVLAADTRISDAALFTLTADKGLGAVHEDYADGVVGFNNGIQAISGDGTQIAQYVQGKIHIYNGDLKHQGVITTTDPLGSMVLGMDFSADGKHLFVLNYQDSRLYEYATSSLKLENVFSLGIDLQSTSSAYGDAVTVSNDGQRLLISGNNHVYAVNLLMAPEGGNDDANVLTGGDGADRLEAFGGDDVLNGGAGNDLLIGGRGADVMSGGAGHDVFVFTAGDSVVLNDAGLGADVVLDFTAEDRIHFDNYPGLGLIEKNEATDFASARAAAKALIKAQPFGGIVVSQVAGDIYVFAGANLNNPLVFENIVKLQGVSATGLTYENFL